MAYIVKITDRGYITYIGASSYRVNKEKYAVLTEREGEAKRYKSYAIAKRAYELLSGTCVNLYGAVEFVKVDHVPAADVAEVKHGGWVVEEFPNCSNCGAKMDGGKNEKDS